jgi:hypothetical protein
VVGFSFDGPGPFGFLFSVVAAVVLIAAWVILAGSRFVQGGVVERPERVPQLYGYTVCLIALVWALSSLVGLVEHGLTLTEPAYERRDDFGIEPSVTSFEAFRLTYDRARRFNAGDPRDAQLEPVAETELRRRYETYRADRARAALVRARQGLVTNGISLLIAAALFAFHWRWLQRRTGVADGRLAA